MPLKITRFYWKSRHIKMIVQRYTHLLTDVSGPIHKRIKGHISLRTFVLIHLILHQQSCQIRFIRWISSSAIWCHPVAKKINPEAIFGLIRGLRQNTSHWHICISPDKIPNTSLLYVSSVVWTGWFRLAKEGYCGVLNGCWFGTQQLTRDLRHPAGNESCRVKACDRFWAGNNTEVLHIKQVFICLKKFSHKCQRCRPH